MPLGTILLILLIVLLLGGFSKEDWATVIKSMVEMGADIKPDQATLIVNYLAANFPPKQK